MDEPVDLRTFSQIVELNSHPFLLRIDFRVILRFYHSNCRKPWFPQILFQRLVTRQLNQIISFRSSNFRCVPWHWIENGNKIMKIVQYFAAPLWSRRSFPGAHTENHCSISLFLIYFLFCNNFDNIQIWILSDHHDIWSFFFILARIE